MVTPAARRTTAAYLTKQHGFSQRRACRLTQLARSTARYRSRRAHASELRQRLRTLAVARPRFGYRRLGILLRREFGALNHKRIYRLYRAEGLSVGRRRRKRRAQTNCPHLPVPTRARQHWAMDFTHDTLARGRSFRTLNLIDRFTRECLAIEVDTSLPAARVIRVLERVIGLVGKPESIRIDNGPEFASPLLESWVEQHQVVLDFTTPGKPTENGHIESFNGKFRDECLSQHWFISLADARALIEQWRIDYNTVRPHSALANRTPTAFAQQHGVAPLPL
jgi:putative transposase